MMGGRIEDLKSASHFQSLMCDVIDSSKKAEKKSTILSNKANSERLIYLYREL